MPGCDAQTIQDGKLPCQAIVYVVVYGHHLFRFFTEVYGKKPWLYIAYMHIGWHLFGKNLHEHVPGDGNFFLARRQSWTNVGRVIDYKRSLDQAGMVKQQVETTGTQLNAELIGQFIYKQFVITEIAVRNMDVNVARVFLVEGHQKPEHG
jgi:hypothetical protein